MKTFNSEASEYQYDAFISYRRRDASSLARWIRDRLQRQTLPAEVVQGLAPEKRAIHERRPRIWLDSAFEKPSDDFLTKKIYPALDNSARLIVVSTPSAFETIQDRYGNEEPNWLVREIDRFLSVSATDKGPRAVDLVLGPRGTDDRFPGRLNEGRSWDWVDCRNLNWWRSLGFSEELDAAYTKLAAGLYDVPEAQLPALRREERRRRNRLLLATSIGGIVLALVIGILALIAWQQKREATRSAEEARRQSAVAEAARSKSQGLVDFLIFDLRDRIAQYVPLEIQEDINRRVADYQQAVGTGDNLLRERSRSVQLSNQGDTLLAKGNLSDALAAYQSSLAIRQELAQQDRSSPDRLRDLSISYDKIGDVLSRQGNFDAALASYQKSLAMAQKLTQKDEQNQDWQRDVSILHERIGDLYLSRGQPGAALPSYEASFTIRQELAKAEPKNFDLERDLAFAHDKLGRVYFSQGELPKALISYKASLKVAAKLVKADSRNRQWQHLLAIEYERIGDVYETQGKEGVASASYLRSLPYLKDVAQSDPHNSEWQRDLSLLYQRLGDIQAALDARAALLSYQSSLSIAQKLVLQDSQNREWQRSEADTGGRQGRSMPKRLVRDARAPRHSCCSARRLKLCAEVLCRQPCKSREAGRAKPE